MSGGELPPNPETPTQMVKQVCEVSLGSRPMVKLKAYFYMHFYALSDFVLISLSLTNRK